MNFTEFWGLGMHFSKRNNLSFHATPNKLMVHHINSRWRCDCGSRLIGCVCNLPIKKIILC